MPQTVRLGDDMDNMGTIIDGMNCAKWVTRPQILRKMHAEQKGWFLLVFYLSLEHIYSFFMIINNNLMYNFSP